MAGDRALAWIERVGIIEGDRTGVCWMPIYIDDPRRGPTDGQRKPQEPPRRGATRAIRKGTPRPRRAI